MAHINIPRISFSHLGLSVTDIAVMERFYTDVMGLTITDRGDAFGFDVIFMSYDPKVHHQIVLSTGRPQDMPQNTIGPMFGPSINQISFQMESLGDLRVMYNRLKSQGYSDDQMMLMDHSISWSVYFPDPEDNKIELFADTDWYISQPFGEIFDFAHTDEEIIERTEAMCRQKDSFRPAVEWRQSIAAAMKKQN